MSALSINRLVGLWRLITIQAIYADGTVDPGIYGASPVGYLTYTAWGHMMVMFGRSDRPPLSGNPNSPFALAAIPEAELAQAFSSFSAYAGLYNLQGDQVHHHITTASIPNRVGTTLVRTVRLSGAAVSEPLRERLILSAPDTLKDGVPVVFELVWERLEPRADGV